jgi:hypothetical protein
LCTGNYREEDLWNWQKNFLVPEDIPSSEMEWIFWGILWVSLIRDMSQELHSVLLELEPGVCIFWIVLFILSDILMIGTHSLMELSPS